MPNIKEDLIYYFVGFTAVFVVIILFIDLVFINNPSKNKVQTTNSEPTQIIKQEPNKSIDGTLFQSNADYVFKNPPLQLKYDSLVGQLEDRLPYSGTNFSLIHNFDNGTITAVMNRDAAQAGNQELDSYLKSQGIESRDWIKNLVIIYQ